MKLRLLIFFAAFVCLKTPAFSQLTFTQPPTINLYLEDTIISIPVSISSPVFGEEYEITLDPAAGSILMNSGYSLLSTYPLKIGAANNKGTIKVLIKRYPAAAGKQSLVFQARIKGSGLSPQPLAITVDYSPTRPLLLDALRDQIAAEDAKYVCDKKNGTTQIVQGSVLDSNLSVVFANVVLSNNDLVQTGTSLSIAQDKDKGTLSFNYSFLGGKNERNALNLGVASRSSGAVFNIFSPESWSKEAGGSVGYTHIYPAKQFFLPHDCEQLKLQRAHYYPTLYNNYRKAIEDKYQQLQNDSTVLAEKYTHPLSPRKLGDVIEHPEYTQEEADSAINSLAHRLYDNRRLLTTISAGSLSAATGANILPAKVKSIVEEDLAAYDYQYGDKLYGYRVWWFDTKVSLNNTTINLIQDSVKTEYRTVLKSTSYLSANVYASLNFSQLGKHKLFFVQGQLALDRGSFLSYPPSTKSPYVVYDSVTTEYSVMSGDKAGKVLGRYEDIEHEAWVFTPSIYGAVFWGKNQNYGVDIRATFRTPLTKIYGADQPNTFTLLAGPVYRITGVDATGAATIGLKLGFSNAVVGSHVAKEYFGAKLEVGVPFSWYFRGNKK